MGPLLLALFTTDSRQTFPGPLLFFFFFSHGVAVGRKGSDRPGFLLENLEDLGVFPLPPSAGWKRKHFPPAHRLILVS